MVLMNTKEHNVISDMTSFAALLNDRRGSISQEKINGKRAGCHTAA